MSKGAFMGKTKDPAKIIKKLEEKIEKLEAQIEESPKKGINLNDEENSIQIGSTFELHLYVVSKSFVVYVCITRILSKRRKLRTP